MTQQQNNLASELESLEVKLAYQEDTIESLNQTVIAQQDQIDRLEQKMRVMLDKLKSIEEPEMPSAGQIELPPHY